MKKILILLATVAIMGSASAQMQAIFGYSTFYQTSDDQPYVETYLLFDAWTLQFVQQSDQKWRAAVEVTLVLRQGDSVCYAKKYDLQSPVLQSPDSLNFNILDVQRFSVRNGIYDLDITLQDKGSEAKPTSVTEKVVILYDRQRPVLSSVQFMSSVKPTQQRNILSRGGYDMEPYVNDFVPEQVDNLQFYFEVYNIDREIGSDAFLAMAYIEQQETGLRVDNMQYASRKHAAGTVPVLGSISIAELPSGNYNLVVELNNREGQTMLRRKMPFYRSNPSVKHRDVSDFANTFVGKYTDSEELNLYLDALYPIASETEVRAAQQLVRQPDVQAKQAFLYEFWMRRNSLSPEAEWLKYKERIDYVQEHFSYPLTRGIVTDRGRVFLQYGPPDFVRDEKNYGVIGYSVSNIASTGNHGTHNTEQSEPGNVPAQYYPYQLWRYNMLPGDDPNRVFLFWDEGSVGYYKLLNSNAKGEVQTYGWERMLSRNQLPEGVVGAVGQQFKRGY